MPTSNPSFVTYKERFEGADTFDMEARFFALFPILAVAGSGFLLGLQRATWAQLSGPAAWRWAFLTMCACFVGMMIIDILQFVLSVHRITINQGALTIAYWRKNKSMSMAKPMVFHLDRGIGWVRGPLPFMSLHFRNAAGQDQKILVGYQFMHEHQALRDWLRQNFTEV